ncbi:MAG: hypothetical protein C4520_06620 [Candidatus Abyssobacteria bacterium SURF_5]|uniref:RsbT co-antagonist protein RsbRD N-terminal domain-containing protein n=1 Tax=Abyssobacteria bacterium (strain SURF_5) TaxID=2093360 RepID=A0A3A4NW61_ABYX5|nr:MAG: hypothetical protein C4520_06620 [Candidatus Abyssubacteria bacterium SURF_5]
MDLRTLLTEKRSEIVAKWARLVFETYAPETSRFLKGEKDRFANPVGDALTRGVEAVYDYLLSGTDSEQVLRHLDDIIRIKAVQDFTPAEALDFLFRLKAVVREEADPFLRENALSVRELLEFETRLDNLALQGFTLFMKCREKIYDLKASQVKDRTFRLLKRANLVVEIPDPEEGPGDVENIKRGKGS